MGRRAMNASGTASLRRKANYLKNQKGEEGNGRGERIRTSGLLVPNQALYQAEPRPD